MYMQDHLRKAGLDVSVYGYASAQLDGGNEQVRPKVRDWFATAGLPRQPTRDTLPMSSLPLAIVGGASSGATADLATSLVRGFVGAGGTVLVPGNAAMLRSAPFLDELCNDDLAASPSLAYAQPAKTCGVHIMDVPVGVVNRVQVLVGLVSSGAGLALVVTPASEKVPPIVGHPFIPVVHVVVEDADSQVARGGGRSCASADLVLKEELGEAKAARDSRWLQAVLELLAKAASHEIVPKASAIVDFQIARGPTGVSA